MSCSSGRRCLYQLHLLLIKILLAKWREGWVGLSVWGSWRNLSKISRIGVFLSPQFDICSLSKAPPFTAKSADQSIILVSLLYRVPKVMVTLVFYMIFSVNHSMEWRVSWVEEFAAKFLISVEEFGCRLHLFLNVSNEHHVVLKGTLNRMKVTNPVRGRVFFPMGRFKIQVNWATRFGYHWPLEKIQV